MVDHFRYLGKTYCVKIPFVKKLRAEFSQGMRAIIRCRFFLFQFSIQNIKIKIYSSVILPVVLYGCETWSLTLREERRLRMFENSVLRRIFGPKRDEVIGKWSRLHK